jgi:hypothetical protein
VRNVGVKMFEKLAGTVESQHTLFPGAPYELRSNGRLKRALPISHKTPFPDSLIGPLKFPVQ